jgi:hypothetical protein
MGWSRVTKDKLEIHLRKAYFPHLIRNFIAVLQYISVFRDLFGDPLSVCLVLEFHGATGRNLHTLYIYFAFQICEWFWEIFLGVVRYHSTVMPVDV